MKKLFLFAFCLLLASCGSRGGPTTSGVGEVTGKVVLESGSPAEGAQVQLIGGGSPSWVLGKDGFFLFTNLPPGSYQIIVTLEGYQTHKSSFALAEGETKNLGTITLKVSAKSRLEDAWEAFENEDYSQAKPLFNEALLASDATAAQRSDAYLGLGWSVFLEETSSTKNSDALSYFNNALDQDSSNLDAEAAALQMLVLLAGNESDLDRAITYGLDVMVQDPDYVFSHFPSFNAADVHALLGKAYFLKSDKDPNDPNARSAQEQIEAALQMEPTHAFALDVKSMMQAEGLWQ